jgi:hypothetical protein
MLHITFFASTASAIHNATATAVDLWILGLKADLTAAVQSSLGLLPESSVWYSTHTTFGFLKDTTFYGISRP